MSRNFGCLDFFAKFLVFSLLHVDHLLLKSICLAVSMYQVWHHLYVVLPPGVDGWPQVLSQLLI